MTMTNLEDEQFMLLVMSLQARLGRLPTEEEVLDFIQGDKETREKIWNSNDKS